MSTSQYLLHQFFGIFLGVFEIFVRTFDLFYLLQVLNRGESDFTSGGWSVFLEWSSLDLQKNNSHFYCTWWPWTRSMAQHCLIRQIWRKERKYKEGNSQFYSSLTDFWDLEPTLPHYAPDHRIPGGLQSNCCRVTKYNSRKKDFRQVAVDLLPMK